MASSNKHISIPKKPESGNDLDYLFLRQKGQEYIEQLSANIWTDYNSHDPGVTMLEMLCYAITDLGNRINLPIEDILEPDSEEPSEQKQFFEASDILPITPVSENDYRKLFIDIEGVKNAWLQAHDKKVFVHDSAENGRERKELSYQGLTTDDSFNLQGLYNLIVDLNDGFDLEDIEDDIRSVYHKNRNLCEDLINIQQVITHSISVCAKIEVEPQADEEKIYAQVELAIENYFSPNVRFYSLKQMLDNGQKTETIFDGPLLQNGFIDEKELEKANLRKEVRLSDIMRLIMKIEGVKVITDISISDATKAATNDEEWVICVEDGKKPQLSPASEFSFYKGVLPLNINSARVAHYRQELSEAENELDAQAANQMKLQIPEGENLNLGDTTTIQNDFPETYGIGQNGVPPKSSSQRKAQVKQLKAYLLFFDQIFASYFAHLEKVKTQLSVNNEFINDSNEPQKTYFTKVVNDLKDRNELLDNYPLDDESALSENLFPGYNNSDDLDNKIARNNALLDHLIARFAEKFSEYSFLMKELYGGFSDRAIIATKESFLKNYPKISKERGLAHNYKLSDEVWNTSNVSGFEKRLARLIGVTDASRRNLSESFVEIYIEDGSKPEVVYRWRIRNNDEEIILSATDDYASPRLAEEELQMAVVKILETPVTDIEKAFNAPINRDDEIGNFLIRMSNEGQYSFDIVNREMPDWDVDYIIARQFSYYASVVELKEAILELKMFMINEFSEEGMFLVEHLLLLPDFKLDSEKADKQFMPVCANGNDCQPIDPYSYRLTIVLPGWTYRFANIQFRRYLEQLIRSELPAHILPRICWVGYRDDYFKLMLETNRQQIEKQRNKLDEIYEIKSSEADSDVERATLEKEYNKLQQELNEKKLENKEKFENQLADLSIFEGAYKTYLSNLAENPELNFESDISDAEDELEEIPLTPCQKLIDAMVELNTIYQQGKLFDCEDETDVLKGRIILDQTNLGTL